MVAIVSNALPLWTPSVGPARTSARPIRHAVAKVDQAALLADVQDDLASLLAAVVRRQSGRRAGADTADNTSANEYEPLPSPPHAEAVAQIRDLLLGAQPRWRMALDLLRGLFPDPTEQALVLAGLRSDPTLSEEIQEEIKAALTELDAQRGQALANSANLGRVVERFSKKGLSAESLRAAYRTLIRANSGERELYRYLIQTFGFAGRGLALDFLEQAVAADLGVAAPAYAPESFGPLLELLLQLRLMRCADNLLLSSLRQKMHRYPHRKGTRKQINNDEESKERPSSDDLVEEALVALLLEALSDVASAQRQFAQFIQRLGTYTERSVLQRLARAILRAMARIPCELFPDLTSRQALLAGLHLTYDQLFTPTHVPIYRNQYYV